MYSHAYQVVKQASAQLETQRKAQVKDGGNGLDKMVRMRSMRGAQSVECRIGHHRCDCRGINSPG